MKKLKRNNKAFSLIEMIVSVAILAIVVLPLLRAFVVSVTTNAKAKDKLRATEASEIIMETLEAKSLEEILDYVSGDSTGLFYETRHTLLTPDGGSYTKADSYDLSASSWYFGLSGVNGKDALVTITANSEASQAGTTLNSAQLVNVSTIDSKHDGIYSVSKTPESAMSEIQSEYPSVEQKDVTRNINVLIEPVNDSVTGKIYTRVTVSYSFTFLSNGTEVTYPSAANAGDFSDVIFDNSPYTDRDLQNIYLFFYPWYTSTLTNGNPTDIITVDNSANLPVSVYLIKQTSDAADLDAKETIYQARVNIIEKMDTDEGEKTKTNTVLRTNLMTNLKTGATVASQESLALNGVLCTEIDKEKIPQYTLTAESTEERLYDVKVEIFDAGTLGDRYYKNFKSENVSMTFTGGMVN